MTTVTRRSRPHRRRLRARLEIREQQLDVGDADEQTAAGRPVDYEVISVCWSFSIRRLARAASTVLPSAAHISAKSS